MNRWMDEDGVDRQRAVSDVVSFTLMFGIIITGVSVVTVSGLPQLTTLSENEEIESAERGMVNAAATFEDMNRYGDLNRSFAIAFSNSQVQYNETELNLTATGGGGTDLLPPEWESLQINALEQVFDREDGDLTALFEGGAAIRSDGGFASYRPAMRCNPDDRRAVVSVVNTTLSAEGLSVGANFESNFPLGTYSVPTEAPISSFDEELRFSARLVDREKRVITTSNSELFVDVSGTSKPLQWSNQLAQQGQWERSNPSDRVVTCDVDRALVTITTIELVIETPRFGS